MFGRLLRLERGRNRVLSLVKPHTMLADERLLCLWDLAGRIDREDIPGDIVECGVYHGGSAALLGSIATTSRLLRTLWLFDSFQGLPDPSAEDGEGAHGWGGSLCGDPDRVQAVLHAVGANMERVRIVDGWFEETLPHARIPRIALLHLDADWYASTRCCLEQLYPHVIPGGFVVIDDYGHWEGCRRAVDEFLSSHNIDTALNIIDYTGRWFQKPVRAQSPPSSPA